MITPVNILIYSFSVFGFWYILGHAEITFRLRDGLKTRWMKRDLSKRYGAAPWYINLIQCPACSGFWIGLFVGLGYLHLSPSKSVLLALFTLTSNSVLFGLIGH